MRPRSYRASGDPRTPGPPRGRFRWAATPPWPSHARRLASTRASPRPGRRRPGPRQPSDWGRIENASWRSCPWPPWLPFRKKANLKRDVRDCLYWMSQDFRICRGSGALVLPDVIVEAAADDAAGEGRVLAAEGALSDGGGLVIGVADEAGDVGVYARDGLAEEFVGEVPDLAVSLRLLKRLGMQGRGGDREEVLADLPDPFLPALIAPQRFPKPPHRVRDCPGNPPARAPGEWGVFQTL